MRITVVCWSNALFLLALAGCASSVPDRTSLVSIASTAPVYPEDLRRSGVSGEVRLDCTITAEGRVGRCSVVAGSDRRFAASALAAEAKARYLPETRGGVPIETTHHIVNLHYQIDSITTATIICRITPTGVAESCTPITVDGQMVVIGQLASMIQKMPHSPRIYRGVPTADPARVFLVGERYRQIESADRIEITPLPGYALHAELYVACFPDLRRCIPVTRGDLPKYLDAAPDTLRTDVVGVAYGITERLPSAGID